MKLALLYIMVLVSCLMGTQQLAFAGQHTGKSSFALVEKQLTQGDHVLGIEDENDEDELTKKLVSNARWLTALSRSFLICDLVDTNRSFPGYHPAYHGCNIYIVQRVLRI